MDKKVLERIENLAQQAGFTEEHLLDAPLVEINEIGQVFAGTIEGIQDTSQGYQIYTLAGKAVSVDNKVIVEGRFKIIPGKYVENLKLKEGDKVFIAYLGQEKLRSGNRMNVFKVYKR